MDEDKSLETALAEAFRQADALEGPLDERLRFYLGQSRKLLPDLESTYDRLVERTRPNAAANRVPAIGAKLPGELFLNVQAALQILAFDEIATGAQELLQIDEDESLSSLTAKISRPIGEGLSVEARYQLYAATFVDPGALSYERHETGLALAWRF